MDDLLLLQLAVVLHDQVEESATGAEVAQDHDGVVLLLDTVDADNILMIIDLLPDLHLVLYLLNYLLRLVLCHDLLQGKPLPAVHVDHLVHEGEPALAQELLDLEPAAAEVHVPIHGEIGLRHVVHLAWLARVGGMGWIGLLLAVPVAKVRLQFIFPVSCD